MRGRLALLDKYDSGFAYADAMVNGQLSRVAEHITACFASIQARLQWGSDKYTCTDTERLSAEQSMEVVIAADEYYRKSVSEPRGSQASWNIRDQVRWRNTRCVSAVRMQLHRAKHCCVK